MRCLIPVDQEHYPENAIERARILCDEVTVLYVLDKRVVERVQSESSYILPSYALENVEDFIVSTHRQRAEEITKRFGSLPANLKFEVGDLYSSLEREAIRERVDMLMTDFFLRALLKLEIPVWIDRGGKIEECTISLDSLKMIRRVKHGVEFSRKICERLGARSFLHYAQGDEEGKKVLEPLGELSSQVRGQLVVLLRSERLKPPAGVSVLVI